MHIADLPPEILHRILFFASLFRGVARALRLKLVCKMFNIALHPALFETRLLDGFKPILREGIPHPVRDWRIRTMHGAEKIWHAYTSYRVRNERDPTVGHYVALRMTAEALCRETGTEDNIDATIDEVCWLALECTAHAPSPHALKHARNPRHNLLSVAAYLGHNDLARRLMMEGHSPAASYILFKSPMYLAALAGNAETLIMFQEHVSEEEKTGEMAVPGYLMPSKAWPIVGAAERGDLAMLKLAIYPPSRAAGPDSTAFRGQEYGKVDWNTPSGMDLLDALFSTKSWEVYQYLLAFFDPEKAPPVTAPLTSKHARYGNVDMVRHLLEMGVNPNNKDCGGTGIPLVAAAGLCHGEVVDLLLSHGADANHFRRSTAMEVATCGGSLAIARTLLDHGARLIPVGLESRPAGSAMGPLLSAVRLEHEAMLELLLDRERMVVPSNLDPQTAKQRERDLSYLLLYAELEGLESMAGLLRARGFVLTPEHQEKLDTWIMEGVENVHP